MKEGSGHGTPSMSAFKKLGGVVLGVLLVLY